MRIDRLRLENFRCFERLDLELHPQVTLLVGTNGAGKSAVLDAVAVAVGAWLSGTSQASREARSIANSDARLVRQDVDGHVTLNPVFPVRVEAVQLAEAADQGELAWARVLRGGGDSRTTYGEARELRELAAWAERQAAEGAEQLLPVLAYYGTGRLWVQKRPPRALKKEQRSRMDGYRACLEAASDHELFTIWMMNAEAARLQRALLAQHVKKSGEEIRAPHLEAVEQAVLALLEGATAFYFDVSFMELRVVFEDGSTLPYTALSDGQRGLIMLAADLAWRCVQLNSILGAEAPAKTEGVVLIDEIELHLHPQWQHRVLGQLHAVFPKVQFVITTHSPQVVSTAAPSWLRVIHPDGRWHGVDYTRGRDSNALLRDVFGTLSRPEFAREAIAEVERLIGQGDAAAARAALTTLEEELGPEDRWVQGLGWELRDLELHGPMPDEVPDA